MKMCQATSSIDKIADEEDVPYAGKDGALPWNSLPQLDWCPFESFEALA